jgi:hypothetical protein
MLQELFRYWLSKKQPSVAKEKTQEESIAEEMHSLSVILHPDDMVDIIVLHPKLDKLSLVEISTEAEKFAELLIYVTNNLMEPKLLTTIRNKIKNTNNDKEQLFYDNVLSYYDVIKTEFEKKLIDNGPLIRPRSVFNSK